MTSTDHFVQRFEIEKSNRRLHVQHFDRTLSSSNCFLEILALQRLWFRNKRYSNNPISSNFINNLCEILQSYSKISINTISTRCSGKACMLTFANVSIPAFLTFTSMHTWTIMALSWHLLARFPDWALRSNNLIWNECNWN